MEAYAIDVNAMAEAAASNDVNPKVAEATVDGILSADQFYGPDEKHELRMAMVERHMRRLRCTVH